MSYHVLLVIDSSASTDFEDARNYAGQLSTALQEPVLLAEVAASRMNTILSTALGSGGLRYQQVLLPKPPVSAAPMGAAPFLWREDGRPDWANMWTGYCELALFGGPPHRGEEQALRAPDAPAPSVATDQLDGVEEIRRGIYETTGLRAEPAQPGWIAVTCDSPKMAAWLCATILLENVEARCEEERLLLPAGEDFELADQIKSVITVLAKTHHYWQAHLAASMPA